jgi:hypothetical protein
MPNRCFGNRETCQHQVSLTPLLELAITAAADSKLEHVGPDQPYRFHFPFESLGLQDMAGRMATESHMTSHARSSLTTYRPHSGCTTLGPRGFRENQWRESDANQSRHRSVREERVQEHDSVCAGSVRSGKRVQNDVKLIKSVEVLDLVHSEVSCADRTSAKENLVSQTIAGPALIIGTADGLRRSCRNAKYSGSILDLPYQSFVRDSRKVLAWASRAYLQCESLY